MRTLLLMAVFAAATVARAATPLWKGMAADSVFVEKTLREAKAKGDRVGNTQLYFARKFIGRPYVAHTLEGSDDRRVVVNTRQLDCTTLVENVVALTLCLQNDKLKFSDFIEALERMRYHGGRATGYASRLHYFTEWIESNTAKGFAHETQQPNPPFTAVQKIDIYYMSQHPSAYEALKGQPALVDSIRKHERAISGRKFRYIPKSLVGNTRQMRQAVKDGDIIAITCNKKGLDIAHLGFAVWRSDGLHLLNASMLHKKVVEEPMTLGQYLSKHPSHTGIRVVRLTEENDQQ